MAVSGRSWARPGLEAMPAWKLEVLERKRAKLGSAPPARDGSPKRGRPEEPLVLQDSLGPLNENPFMKKEKERRRRGPHHSPTQGPPKASPIRHLLDMYSNVPGIRTIRADNIIIIESDPTYFTRGPSGESAGARAHRDPMDELLAKRGSKVAEIRASEVVIYETDPPAKAAEPGSLGQEDHAVLEEAGRVSRLLEKFNQRSGKPSRSRSWENLLDGDSRPPQPKPPVMPKPGATERHSHAPVSKTPRRSGERSPSPASALDEDSKRFPLNSPTWLPSKPPVVHSVPNPGLFHKKPNTPPPLVVPVSLPPVVVGPLSSHYETSTDEKILSPVVASVIEKFEVGSSQNNLPKFVTQKTGKNTIVINPKAAQSHNSVKPHTGGGMTKPSSPLMNGHVEPSDGSSKPDGSIKIEDLLSKSRQSKGAPVHRLSEGGGKVLSTTSGSKKETNPGAKSWAPKTEVDYGRPVGAPESSATKPDSSLNPFERSFSSATPSQQKRVLASTSDNDSFEIRPAPKPDMKSIPENDIQAKALANIRMQSKNSFTFVPKKRQVPSVPKQDNAGQSTVNKPKVKASAFTSNGPKADSSDSPRENGIQTSGREGVHQEVKGDALGKVERLDQTVTQKVSTTPALSDFDWKSGLLPGQSTTEGHSFTDVGAELEYISSVHQEKTPETPSVPLTYLQEDTVKSDIPVTNIDDLVNHEASVVPTDGKLESKGVGSPMPSYRPHASLSSVRNKAGNTFTVVPKRKPITEQEAFRTPVAEEEDDEDSRSKRKSSDGNDAPFSELGALLKKRYPTVDEIQVIGGYLSLSKTCLSKNGSTRKKMKISFNEQKIQTTYEYPSESSLAEGESNEGSDSESEDELPPSPFLPRAKFVNSSVHPNPTSSGLSSYTPKHSMDFNEWQEDPSKRDPASRDSAAPQDNLITLADSGALSDFRSEPALYF